MRNLSKIGATAALLFAAFAAGAQQPTLASAERTAREKTASDSTKKEEPRKVSLYRPLEINHFRPADQRGVNMFETPKEDLVPFNGFVLSIGGAFTQEYQGLAHENRANPVLVNGVNTNQLVTIGRGFNNAVANLNVNAQLAPGIRVAMTSYLSARHHQETWVKDGYILIDDSPIDNALLKGIMKYTTMKVGHFEINYGDAHFRRSDNGNAMYNPFIGNYILDAFTTEVGAEIYLRHEGVIAMGSVTGGEIRGTVINPGQRSASYIGKLGVDRQVKPNLRLRV